MSNTSQLEELNAKIKQLEAERDALQAQNAVMREALGKYDRHGIIGGSICGKHIHSSKDCDCGLEQAISLAQSDALELIRKKDELIDLVFNYFSVAQAMNYQEWKRGITPSGAIEIINLLNKIKPARSVDMEA